jgi:heme exporter protein B
MWTDLITLVKKDLLLEWRMRENIININFFAISVLLVLSFAFDAGSHRAWLRDLAPGALWVAIAFSGVLMVSRIFTSDQEQGAMTGLRLAPISPHAIYLSKLVLSLAIMTLIEIVMVILLIVWFDLPTPDSVQHLGLSLFLGTLGLLQVGILFSAMFLNTRLKDVLLPILFYPVVTPILIAATRATEAAMSAPIAGEGFGWLPFLAGCDLTFGLAAWMLFPAIVSEN